MHNRHFYNPKSVSQFKVKCSGDHIHSLESPVCPTSQLDRNPQPTHLSPQIWRMLSLPPPTGPLTLPLFFCSLCDLCLLSPPWFPLFGSPSVT